MEMQNYFVNLRMNTHVYNNKLLNTRRVPVIETEFYIGR